MSYGDSARLSNEIYFNAFSDITPSKIHNIKDSVRYVIEKFNGRKSGSENVSEDIIKHFCKDLNTSKNGAEARNQEMR